MRRTLSLWICALGSLMISANAWSQCIDVVDVATELPYEVATPKQANLSYFYNLETEQYVIFVSKGAAGGTPYGPFVLTRGCAPARLRWESDEFVLLQGGCGTFCWEVLALSLSGEARYQHIMRPMVFDEERNLVASYAAQDTITITNLSTGREQHVATARQCQSTSEVCFEARFDGDVLMYTWRYEPTETFTARLDRTLLEP